jgi:hypothetical protein
MDECENEAKTDSSLPKHDNSEEYRPEICSP